MFAGLCCSASHSGPSLCRHILAGFLHKFTPYLRRPEHETPTIGSVLMPSSACSTVAHVLRCMFCDEFCTCPLWRNWAAGRAQGSALPCLSPLCCSSGLSDDPL
ncbi:unnamed protein product, partial [Scytosiphon promiscuus]